ncbi:hypothetical protein ACFFJ4_14455 [Xanthomonas dyei]
MNRLIDPEKPSIGIAFGEHVDIQCERWAMAHRKGNRVPLRIAIAAAKLVAHNERGVLQILA